MLKIVITTTLLVCTSSVFSQEREVTEEKTPVESQKTTTIVVTENQDPIFPMPKADKKVNEGEKKAINVVAPVE